MNFTEAEKISLASIAAKHPTSIQLAIAEAYEAGILEGALRAARAIGNKLVEQQNAAAQNNNDGDGDDDLANEGVSLADAAWLRSQGIDPGKKFRCKNSLFTITGVKRSRWKFPISAINTNGTRYKWPVDRVKMLQAQTR